MGSAGAKQYRDGWLHKRAFLIQPKPASLDFAGVGRRVKAAVAAGLARKLGIDKKLYAVENTRGGISKKSMIHNGATPKIEVDPETYEVRADGELLTCAPAEVLPMAQRYFMF